MIQMGFLESEVLPRIDEVEVLNDSNGPYAVVGEHEIVVARNYIQSNGEVSAHFEAVERAAETERSLLMYVDSDEKWINFDPGELIASNGSWKNERKGETMLNFPADWGQDVDIRGEI